MEPEFPEGTSILNNTYGLTGVMGSGGYGKTYKAIDRETGNKFAAKILKVYRNKHSDTHPSFDNLE
jgi:serine/threonine protein kinase